MAASAWTMRPHDPAPRSEWAGRPRYAPSDFVVLLWRERFLMFAVFAVLFALGVAAANDDRAAYDPDII